MFFLLKEKMTDSEVFDFKKADEDLKQRYEESVAKCGSVEGVQRLKCEKSTIEEAGNGNLETKLAESQEEAEKKCASALSGIIIKTQ